MDRGHELAWALFERLGVIPSHRVFGGFAGDRSRKYWAARLVATGPRGEERTLLEWPRGMVQPFFRLLEDPTDVAWLRHFDERMVNGLMRSTDPRGRALKIEEMRKNRYYDRVLGFFCESALFDEYGERAEVRLEAFWAGISYRTGEIVPDRATLHATDCRTRRGTHRWPLPRRPPKWPLLAEGFDWETVR
jgi:hypothetical protein